MNLCRTSWVLHESLFGIGIKCMAVVLWYHRLLKYIYVPHSSYQTVFPNSTHSLGALLRSGSELSELSSKQLVRYAHTRLNIPISKSDTAVLHCLRICKSLYRGGFHWKKMYLWKCKWRNEWNTRPRFLFKFIQSSLSQRIHLFGKLHLHRYECVVSLFSILSGCPTLQNGQKALLYKATHRECRKPIQSITQSQR